MFRFIAIGLLALAFTGCAMSVEHNVTFAPNNHGHYVPVYKLVLKHE